MTGSRSAPQVPQEGLTYEESKRLLSDGDAQVRAELAARNDIRPEILYYLAGDESATVRRRVAGNPCTPGQADLLLACDRDQDVRGDLAQKVARLLPELSAGDLRLSDSLVVETLELLSQDQATRVRGVLAKTLKDLEAAPPSVIQRLARDEEAVVACPVLEFSPILSEADLLEIIAETGVSAKLTAISRRDGLGARVSDAIAASDDEGAIAALLSNHGAQIREETLDQLVERARGVTDWHAPLVHRPHLSANTAHKLASFVAHNLLDRLRQREGLDAETLRAVDEELQRRLQSEAPEDDGDDATAEQVAAMFAAGELNEGVLVEALLTGDRAFLRHAFARLADLPTKVIEKILIGGSAKGQTALVWRAGLTMAFATKLQLHVGGIPPQQVIKPGAEADFPLSREDMEWQLELFESLAR